jgi:hypothetical protein
MSIRERIIGEIKRCGEKLGRAPSKAELHQASGISWHQVYKHFRGMRAAVRAAGLEPGPRGGPLDVNALVLDWARVVRELGRLPSRAEYDERGKHHSVTLHARIGWSQMAHKFVLLVREFHIEREWADVVDIVVKKFPLLGQMAVSNWQIAKPFTAESAEDWVIGSSGHRVIGKPKEELFGREFARMNTNQGMRLGKVVAAALAVEILMAAERSIQQSALSIQSLNSVDMKAAAPVVYGEPLGLRAMAHAPTNEDGVLFLFGVLAAGLGFRVERIQKAFPDCEAKREVAPGKWELVFVEFELYSRNFKEHGHDPTKCHAIVCWKHNWPDVPEGLEVIELSKVVT